MIEPVYHAGELAVQAQAGVTEQALHTCAIIRTDIPKIAREFLQSQRMVIVATLDSGGQVWVSALSGPPGFMQAVDSQTIKVSGALAPGDPLAENLKQRHEIGMIAVEFSTRRRMKIKGQSERASDGTLIIHPARVYSQCTKYIQAREPVADSDEHAKDKEVIHGSSLTPDQQQWIANADTFFVASFHPETGADASHRGGNPGFVKVMDKETLIFPNYWGNSMFNTLGNITVDPHAGLLLINFATGSTLQITGTAYVIWDKNRVATVPGANQLVEYRVAEVIETPNAMRLRWRFVAYSSANPG